MMVITRSRPLASVAEPSFSASSATRARCSEISFPTSLGDKPSGTAALLSDVTRPAVPVLAAGTPAGPPTAGTRAIPVHRGARVPGLTRGG